LDPSSSQVIDLAQDSDEENEKVKHKRQRKNPEFDDIKIFFSEPYRRKGDVSELSLINLYYRSYFGIHAYMILFWKPDNKPPNTYRCLWCKKEVRVSGSSLSNLRTHRDGSRQTGRVSDGCAERQKALDNGAKLPITSLQEIKTKTDKKEGSIASHFNRAEKFDNETLNNIISLWLIRQAIPWSRIEDPYLRAAFHYCQPGSELFKRKWAATSGRVIYLDLKEAMLNRLKVCNYSLHFQKPLILIY